MRKLRTMMAALAVVSALVVPGSPAHAAGVETVSVDILGVDIDLTVFADWSATGTVSGGPGTYTLVLTAAGVVSNGGTTGPHISAGSGSGNPARASTTPSISPSLTGTVEYELTGASINGGLNFTWAVLCEQAGGGSMVCTPGTL